MDTPGLVGGRYRPNKLLGSGGMGAVWQATDELLQRQVAIKQVQAPPGLSDDDRRTLAQRTLREARAAAAISSPSVVTVFDVVDDGDMPWIVMELLHARTLSSVIADQGPLAVPDVVRIGLALLDGLGAAHAAGVLHRDVKPSNVMVDDRGGVVLTDFGVAILDGDATLTSTGALIGSPAYLAPERARGEPATPASDLWSLGATLYTAVEGRPPFQREGPLATLAAVMTDPPAATRSAGALAPLLDALLVKDPVARPGPDEVRSWLRRVLDAPDVDASTPLPGSVPVDAAALAAAQRTGVVPVGRRPVLAQRPLARRGLLAAVGVLCATALVAALLVLRPGYSADAQSSDAGATSDPSSTATLSGGAGGAGAGVDGAGVGGAGAEGAATDASPVGGGAPAEPGATQSGSAQPRATGRQATPRGSQPRATAGQPSQTPSSQPPPAPATDSATGPANGPGGVAVPAGYRSYTDPAGWSLAVPEGWREERDGSRIDFRSPDGAFLRVDSTDTPAGDPVADWTKQEQSVSRRLAGYQRISILAVEYRGWDSADWRFTWEGSRNRIQVLNRAFVVAADEAHALYYSAPVGVYDESVHEVAAATFTPRAR